RVTGRGIDAWRHRPESPRAKRDRHLKVLARASFTTSKQRYGSPRIHRDLREDHHERVSRKRIIRLMQGEGLRARTPNLLNREFTAEARNQRWVGDTMEFKIGESGTLYLAAILDLFSRCVVGWAVSAVNDRHLTLTALTVALNRRCPEIGLLHHSIEGRRTRVTTIRIA